jgi:hypothetical protein
VAATNGKEPFFYKLPKNLQKQTLALLTANKPIRAISQFLKENGYSVSPMAVHRYKRGDFAKTLDAALKLKQAQSLNQNEKPNPAELTTVAKALILADPIVSRVEAQYERFDEWYVAARKVEKFEALASISNAEIRALQLHAQLTGRLNLQPQTNVLVALVTGETKQPEPAQSDETGEVIDVEPMHDES